MKTQFTNTVEQLKANHLRAVSVSNHDTGAEIVCNKTGAELTDQFGSIEDFFNGLFQKGIKAIKITDKLKNGSSFRKYGDEFIFEFEPAEPMVNANFPQVVPPQAAPLNGGLNAGLNATIYRDMDYPRVVAELEAAKADVKRLSEENRKLETKILINETLEGKSIARSEANAKLMESATPLLAALTEKLMATSSGGQVPGLAGANLSEVKNHAIKMVSQLQDDLVDSIAVIMARLNNPEIMNEMLALADKAEKL